MRGARAVLHAAWRNITGARAAPGREMTATTRLFRNRAQLSVLFDEVFPAVSRGGTPVRVLVHACADGSEPYSIAVEWLHRGRPLPLQIVAADRDARLVAAARRGQFARNAVREAGTRAGYGLEGFFEPRCAASSTVEASDEVRSLVDFEVADLASPADQGRLGTPDVLLAQNVLIHLAPRDEASVMQALCDWLAPGGWLVVAGRTEAATSILRARGFLPHRTELRAIHEGCAIRRHGFEHAAARGEAPPYWALGRFDESVAEPEYRFGTIFRKPAA